jgi:hypothetical protein
MYVDVFGHEHRYGPPTGYVRPDGIAESLGPADWVARVARGLQFAPYTGTDVTCRLASGTCLEPLVTAGEVLVLRPMSDEEALIDGGLYVIDWHDARACADYRESVGMPAGTTLHIAKFLRYVGGDWWCECKDNISRLNGTVIAMVVGLEKLRPLRFSDKEAATAFAASLDPNAASQVLSVSGSNWGGTTNAASPQTFTSLTLTLIATGEPVSIDVSGTYIAYTSATGTPSISMFITRDGAQLPGSITGYFTTGTLPNSLLISPTPVSIIATDSPAAGAHVYGVSIVVTGATGGSGSYANTFCDMSNYTIKVREYKR